MRAEILMFIHGFSVDTEITARTGKAHGFRPPPVTLASSPVSRPVYGRVTTYLEAQGVVLQPRLWLRI